MRVAFVAESFLPHMNGVTGSVLHAVRHLEERGHETVVIAPGAPGATSGPDATLLPSVPLPGYPQVRVALAGAGRVAGLLRAFEPDVVHLASPFALGWRGVTAAETLGLPTVAVYQTDVIAYARKYGVPHAAALTASHVARLHRRATMTLAPSASALRQLEELGVPRTHLWARGVDTARFRPDRRSDAWRAHVAPGRVVVGYVGRLAAEKQVEDLAALGDLPGIRLVVVGDGPMRARLEQRMPEALFCGHLSGLELAQAVASFDVFVHPGESETFGQTIQEAHASGVPVVATGVGGPLDLVRSSVDGWLYRPGDLDDLRARVADLVGDEAKRRAFGVAAREAVQHRTWPVIVDQLIGYYEAARNDRVRPRAAMSLPVSPAMPATVRRYVALGDSITEGLWDTSRMPDGEVRGWADRLAAILAGRGTSPLQYANIAVRSRRIGDLLAEQLPRALALRPDVATILIGANDLVGASVDAVALARAVEPAVAALRAEGAAVVLIAPFLPRRRPAALLVRRFARFAAELERVAAHHGAIFVGGEELSGIDHLGNWAHDKVHLSSQGHRLLAYRVAQALGVRDAETLGELDAALHADPDVPPPGTWLTRDALPWAWRRVRGRTAGDDLSAKHDDYVMVPGGGENRRVPTAQD